MGLSQDFGGQSPLSPHVSDYYNFIRTFESCLNSSVLFSLEDFNVALQ